MAPDVSSKQSASVPCEAIVIWIDWYAYHFARFAGLKSAFGYHGEVIGLEMVGGIGVHAGLNFRERTAQHDGVETLLPQSSWRAASKLRLAGLVWSRLSHHQPRMVLVPGYYTLPALAAAVWARLHRRTSVLMTESTAEDHTRASWKEWLKSVVIRTLFDSAVCGGSAHVRYLQQLKFRSGRIALFYDVVDNTRLHDGATAIREKRTAGDYGLPSSYFLYVGRLAPEKNVVGLLQAWLQYRESGGTWPLVLAGDGPEASTLRGVATASPFCADVIFTGHQTSGELLPMYSFAGCIVLASTREPWGLVVNEAMACGLPVIVSSRCGCAEDLVAHGVNGYVFDPRKADELTHHLHMVAQSSTELRGRMGKDSMRRVLPFSPERFGQEVASFLRRPSPLLAEASAAICFDVPAPEDRTA